MDYKDLIDKLIPTMREKAINIKTKFDAAGDAKLLIYSTLRTLKEQARLYRQGRSFDTIVSKVNTLNKLGFGFLADIIVSVGPQFEKTVVTNAAPGESWHNYGAAFDAVPTINNKALWSYDANKKLWNNYGKLSKDANCIWGGSWKNLKDYPHTQLYKTNNPLLSNSPARIKNMLKEAGNNV